MSLYTVLILLKVQWELTILKLSTLHKQLNKPLWYVQEYLLWGTL